MNKSSTRLCFPRRWSRLFKVLLVGAIASSGLTSAAPSETPRKQIHGPLRICSENPRYFTDDSGRAVYLTGAHTWNNFQEMGPTDPPTTFDFNEYLKFLERHHHNFIRLWRWELVSWNTEVNHEKDSRIHFCTPHPWVRAGTEKALDGKPRFDLKTFDEAYFQRLHSRLAEAGHRGVYVSVMLFEGWGMQFVQDAWKAHPFNPANNSSGVGKEVDPSGKGLSIYTLAHPEITKLQETYVRKVVDTVNDLDNVLYEISNENHPPSTEWQYHFIRFVHDYEKTKPKLHPVGMSFQYQGGANATLMKSPADWVSPNPDSTFGYDYRTNPPPADGTKVILTDTDHLWGIGGDVTWVWKSFLRGLNPLFMDPYKQEILTGGKSDQWEPVRQALGVTRRFADRMKLLTALPHPELVNTTYCLAAPGNEYLVFQPKIGEPVSLKLEPGQYHYEWFDSAKGTSLAEGLIRATAGGTDVAAPSSAATVLYVKRQ